MGSVAGIRKQVRRGPSEKSPAGLKQELELAEASPRLGSAPDNRVWLCRTCAATCIGMRRGRELLRRGVVNLWDGMCSSDRNAVRALPATDPSYLGMARPAGGEPAPFTGTTATLIDPRIFSPGCAEQSTDDLKLRLPGAMQAGNYLVDYIGLANGGRFPYLRNDCRRPAGSLRASAQRPIRTTGRTAADGDMLAKIEASTQPRFDQRGPVYHWVADKRPRRHLHGDLVAAASSPRPRECKAYASLRQSIIALGGVNWLGNGPAAKSRRSA